MKRKKCNAQKESGSIPRRKKKREPLFFLFGAGRWENNLGVRLYYKRKRGLLHYYFNVDAWGRNVYLVLFPGFSRGYFFLVGVGRNVELIFSRDVCFVKSWFVYPC